MATGFEEPKPNGTAMLESSDPSTASECVTIKNGNSDQLWRSTLVQVWEEGVLSDMTLEVGDFEYKVHSLTMVTYSSYLKKRILQADMGDQHCKIKLNLDPVMVKKALEFMYVGNIEVPRSQLEGIRETAVFLGINLLRDAAMKEQLLDTQVTVDNCLPVWESASLIQYADMADTAKAVALKNFAVIQHKEDFSKMSAKLVKEYLGSKELKTRREEERLFAAVGWVRVDSKHRRKYLCSIIDQLPLDKMGSSLEHVLNEPFIKESAEAKRKIQGVIDSNTEKYPEHQKGSGINNRQMTSIINPGLPPRAEDKSQTLQQNVPKNLKTVPPEIPVKHCKSPNTYLVLAGAYKDNCINEVIAVNISKDLQCMSLGQIEAEFDRWTNCCILGNHLYVAGLGTKHSEIWSLDLKNRYRSLLGMLNPSRTRHGMVAYKEKIYVIGGLKTFGKNVASSSLTNIEGVNTVSGKCYSFGYLSQYICFNNIRCCTVDGDKIAVVGAQDDQNNTVIQIWCPPYTAIKAAIHLRQNLHFVYGVVQAGGLIIVVSQTATVVCGVEDIFNNEPGKVKVCTRYKSPNRGCAVVLKPQGYILLVGGMATSSKRCCVYTAMVDDLVNDTGPGWLPLETQCNLEGSFIYGYSMTGADLFPSQ